MLIASRLGEGDSPASALAAALDPLPHAADVVLVTAPASWITPGLASRLAARFEGAAILAGSASGVVGGGIERQGAPAVAVTTLQLPSGRARWVDVDAPRLDGDEAVVLTLGTPEAVSDVRLARLAALPVPVVGGLVSGRRGNERVLARGEVTRGVAALALSGAFTVETGVAQGCRPPGEPMIVVRADGHRLLELDAGRPLDVLRALHLRSRPEEQARLRDALFLGVQMRDQTGPYRRGDFLVRPLLGAEPDRGVLAVAARLDGHPVVQFHVRDAESSRADLLARLEGARPEADGALMFTCLGRGEGLYGEPNHDAQRLSAALFERDRHPAPLGGLFCNGELGPVGGALHLHTYTTVWAAFYGSEDAE
ncbi:MAG: FIST N-terminal domain-containing protein [Sandaracinaceae bacterium]